MRADHGAPAMTALDWLIVLLLNGPVIALALARSRDTHTSGDWFLAGRTLPFWMIGLSLYATFVDTTDLVADSGATFNQGVRFFIMNWLGVLVGWLLLAHGVILPIYRRGMFTNAEYLEARFGVATRVLSVLVQVLYRSVIMGMIATANFLTLRIVCGWEPALAWSVVAGVAVVATIYTMAGGLKSVVLTDAMQSVVMFAAMAVIFGLVWREVDGWSGMAARLTERDPVMAGELLHAGTSLGGVSAWLIGFNLMLAGLAYAIVNHTQSMRLLGARSETDLKGAVVVGGVLLVVATFLSQSMGLMGRALFPELEALPVPPDVQSADAIFPVLVRDVAGPGLKGLMLAGVMAAAFSTYDSIGSTLSALITRDIYARLLVRDREDHHYLTVGRWLTPVVILGSFLYVPTLLRGGLVGTYLAMVGSFVVPLLAVYLLGAFTRVHRSSAVAGLVVGVGYGVYALLARQGAEGMVPLPDALKHPSATGPCAFGLTILAMLAWSCVRGWEARGWLGTSREEGWLARSRAQIQVAMAAETGGPERAWPLWAGLAVLAVALYLTFVVFW